MDNSLNKTKFQVNHKDDSTILLWINSTISDVVIPYFTGSSTSYELWKSIEERFVRSSSTHSIQLHTKLMSLKQGDKTVSALLNEIKSISDQLAAAGSKIRNPPVSSIELHNLLISEELIVSERNKSLITESSNRAFAAESSNQAFSASYRPSGRGGGRGTHFFHRGGGRTHNNVSCRGYGSGYGILPTPSSTTTPIYPYARPPPSDLYSGDKPTCQICRKYSHDATECWNCMNFAYQGRQPPRNICAMLAAANIFGENPWYMDSGANNHLTSDVGNLEASTSYSGADVIGTANGAAKLDTIIPNTSYNPAATDLNTSISSTATTTTNIPPTVTTTTTVSAGSNDQNTHNMLTRSKHDIFKPKYLLSTKHPIPTAYLANTASTTPTCYSQAAKILEWLDLMHVEHTALQDVGTWSLVPPDPSQNLVGCKWVFKTKYNADGTLERRKARLVAKGFHQLEGLDYTDTFSPVVKPATIRLVLSIAVNFDWKLTQLDINNAFFMSLYGLKQAPRAWYEKLVDVLVGLDFIPSPADSRNDSSHCASLISYFGTHFPVKDLGDIHYFLGLEHMQAPTTTHLTAAKRVLRYIKGTLGYGLLFSKGFTALQGYTDEDWDGNPDDRRSTSGHCIFFGFNPVSWSSKKQPTISRSSTEAEYRMKHLAIDFHFVRELVQSKHLQVTYISSLHQAADIFTKGLSAPRFGFLRDKLKILHPLQLEGG
ncbi:hypothetical protein C5167_034525 [Papaver somniferum]|uniref:Reverse transcriptase Ty1/copia-type domain-containing protein n=1 Tax=Papaver somniferum TaxID=3469 RepID=A0A4Y7KG36_PAPSO|nr:hypothetical protein C5167_034525 [Papaver somniferum]